MAATDSRPNVVLIMTDQQRGGVTARRGFPLDTMPFMDSIAQRGTWTDRHYTAVPQCVPGRASVLTGRTSSGNGVRINPQIKAPMFERDLIDVMNDAGYRTGFSGKDHCYLDGSRMDHWYTLGHQGGSQKNEAQRRYDEWLEEEIGFGVSFEPAPVEPEDTCAGRVVTDSIEWIDSLDGSEPFFLNMWLPEPHSPYHVPEPYFSLFDPEDVPELPSDADDAEAKGFDYVVAQNSNLLPERLPEGVTFEEALPEIRSLYYGMIRMVDDQLRRFFEFLDERGIREDTLLVFTSDHGDYAGSYGMMRKGAGLCEALTNVPLIVDGPGVESSDGAHPMHTALWDLLPTLADVAGEEIPRGVQGRSFWPVVTGADYPEAEFDSVYLECGDGGVPYRESDAADIDTADRQYALARVKRGVRSGDWKLIHDTAGTHSFHLYDVEADPEELHDVADEHPEVLADLKDELLRWTGRLDAFEHPDEPKAKRNPHNWWDHPDWESTE